MGPSPWDKYNSKDRPPLPLLHGTELVEQPTDLNKLEKRYTDFAISFMKNATASATPFLLYYAFNHVHVPDFSTAEMCNSSRRGRFGDAIESLDKQVGFVMTALKGMGPEVENNTVIFFTSDK
jgi:arylsulfatase A